MNQFYMNNFRSPRIPIFFAMAVGNLVVLSGLAFRHFPGGVDNADDVGPVWAGGLSFLSLSSCLLSLSLSLSPFSARCKAHDL